MQSTLHPGKVRHPVSTLLDRLIALEESAIMKKLIVTLGLALGVLAGALPARADPITVYLAPSTVTVGTGTAFSVNVMVSGLAAGDNVSGFDLNLLFNGSLIAGVDASENAPLFGFSVFGPATSGAGDLGLEGTSFETDADLIALQNPASDPIVADFAIATFNFMSGALNGSTRIEFGTVAPFESNVLGLLDANGNATTHVATFVGTCVVIGTQGGTCAQVPEPASYALVGVALLGAVMPSALRRRRERQTAR